MDNQQERREAAIYLAAMIQCDGTITAYWRPGRKASHKHSIGAKVVFYNTDKDTIENVVTKCEVLGITPHVYGYYQTQGDTEKKMGYVVIQGYKRLQRFLPHLIPFLVSYKKDRAEKLLELSEVRCALPKDAPYAESQLNMLRAVFNTGKFLESSTTIRSTS